MIFLMVVFFGVDYGDVVIATIIPSVLFYLGVLVQVDGYAARNDLMGSADLTAKWWVVLREGWVYLAGLAVLIYGLVYMRWGAITPLYASALVLALQVLRWGWPAD